MLLDIFTQDFVRINNISDYSYASYTRKFGDIGDFEIRVPISDEALQLSQAKFVLLEKNVIGEITYVKPVIDASSGKNTFNIKGKMGKYILHRRCIPKTTNFKATPSEITREMVRLNCIEPTDSKRELPIVLSTDEQYNPSGGIKSTQVTGGYLDEKCEEQLSDSQMDYDLIPVLTDTAIQNLEYRVIKGVDRTKHNEDGNSPVLFSRDMKNIQELNYEYNENDFKNVAYVAGEGEGASRALAEAGETSSEGFDRREMYVDARDLQSTDENGNTMTASEYQEALISRGLKDLKENVATEAAEATIAKDSQFIPDVDFFLGDFVTIEDPEIGLALDAQVTEMKYSSQGKNTIIDVTFGHYKLSTNKKLQRKGVL